MKHLGFDDRNPARPAPLQMTGWNLSINTKQQATPGNRRASLALFQQANSKMATTTTDIFFKLHHTKPATSRMKSDTFDEQFSRCHNALHFIACRILADPGMAACAVRNCRLKASRNPPSFETEGAFRSWALRLLISEALSILHRRP